MIKFIFLIFLNSAIAACPDLKWEVTKAGMLELPNGVTNTEFIFLSPTEILTANFHSAESLSAPLQIYKKANGKWLLDKEASKGLPSSFHPRQMLTADVDGDNVSEVVIADHGPDTAPFPGSFPLIIRKQKGKWLLDQSSKTLQNEFTFNVAVLKDPSGKSLLYKANVPGKGSVLFSFEKTNWVDSTKLIPSDLHAGNLCFMTALASDFDGNGESDLYLGGCDRPSKNPLQANDRILSLRKGKWTLEPMTVVPFRKADSSWGTVFLKAAHMNDDKLPDILVSTHDFGFHTWKTFVLENQSKPGAFKFKEIPLPISPEKDTEGFVYALENFKVNRAVTGILAEVRSVLRDKLKKHPQNFNRLILKKNGGYVDGTSCLPPEILKEVYHTKTFPDDPSRLLLLPYRGEILELTAK